MTELIKYINEHSIRGACTCGQCIDAPENPEEKQPEGHTANVEFFKVSLRNEPDAEILRKLVMDNKGEFNDANLFDGKEHSYIEIGAWIGDQGYALILMGMGELLGLWKLLTPTSFGMPEELRQMMAGQGLVTIIKEK